MDFKKIIVQLNIVAQCRHYGIPLRQCPQLLFLLMGAVIIVAALATYSIGAYFLGNPETAALIVLFLTLILFVIGSFVTQSFERLAEANRMKSEFIDIVSHQLRTPLTSLKWTIEILTAKGKEKSEKQEAEYFEILKEDSSRMGELVDGLLTVSRLQEGKLPLRREEFSLLDLVKGLIKQFTPFAEGSGVKIELKAEDNLPRAVGDPQRVKSVVENLLHNAIGYGFRKDAREEGDKKIEVSLEKRGGEKICLKVKDNGIGIPAEEQKYIFQKFFRARNAMEQQTKGSGLGLYIAKSIIEKSGGKIGFISQENKGTTFWVTLPIKQ